MKRTNDKGITLIALVITIIILLLLAAVAWGALNDGIIRNADRSVNLFNRQANADQNEIDKVGGLLDKYTNDLAPDVPDITDSINLPEKKALSEFPDYIPIYKIEQYAKIASGEQGYVINDLSETYVGTYNMNNNAKYVIMNDLDFSSQTLTEILPEFKGILEGNGCKISGIRIDARQSSVAYTKLINEEGASTDRPGGMFIRVSGGAIKNLLVENANVVSNESAGAIVAQSYNAIIDNCYVKSSTITGGPNAGGILGLDFNGSTITNCKNINTIVNSTMVDESKWVSMTKKTGGIVGVAFGSITLTNNQTISTGNPLELKGGIIAQVYYYYHNSNENYNKAEIQTTLGLTDEINIDVNNCHVNNIELTIGGGAAGIIGDITTYSKPTMAVNINISKCTSKKLIGDGAGIVASISEYSVLGGKILINECALQDGKLSESLTRMNISSSASPSSGGLISGIAGNIAAPELVTVISDCHVKGLIANSKENIGEYNCGGVIATIGDVKSGLEIKNCTVEDSEIFTGTRFNATGGIAGDIRVYAYQGETEVNIKNCTVANLDIYNKNGQLGGILGDLYISSDTNVIFENCKTFNSNLLGDIETGGNPYSMTGGILGNSRSFSEKYSTTFRKCKVDNIKVEKGCGHIGGIFGGYCGGNEFNIEECSVSNMEGTVGIKSTMGDGQLGTTSLGGIGGCITFIEKSVNIVDSKVNNIRFLNINGYSHMGGIAGLTYNSDADTLILGCEANKIELYSQEGDGNISRYSDGGSYGGIVGHMYQGESRSIKKCNANDLKISSIYGNAGGIAGSEWAGIDIQECNVKNAKITGLQSSGGIIGGDYGWTTKIENCNVENIELGVENYASRQAGGIAGFCNKAQIINCKGIKVKAKGVKDIAGICGNIQEGSISNINIDNIELTNDNYTEGRVYMYKYPYMNVGGIYASTASGVSVNDCTINNLNINITTQLDNIKENIGGAVGYAGYSKIDNCNIMNSTIISNNTNNDPIETYGEGATNFVGGIVAITATEVTNCSIKNSQIEHRGSSNYCTAGIYGHATTNSIIRNCNVEDVEIIGKAITAGICSSTAVPTTIDNCTIKNSIITGTIRVGGLVGVVHDKTQDVGLQVDLTNNTITNTKIKGRDDYDYYVGWKLPEEKVLVLTGTSYDAQTTLEAVAE